jgi:hypothetical protein
MLFKIESYGYTMTDLIYDWQTGKKSVEVRFLFTQRRKAEREEGPPPILLLFIGYSKSSLSSLPNGKYIEGYPGSFSTSFRQLFHRFFVLTYASDPYLKWNSFLDVHIFCDAPMTITTIRKIEREKVPHTPPRDRNIAYPRSDTWRDIQGPFLRHSDIISHQREPLPGLSPQANIAITHYLSPIPSLPLSAFCVCWMDG